MTQLSDDRAEAYVGRCSGGVVGKKVSTKGQKKIGCEVGGLGIVSSQRPGETEDDPVDHGTSRRWMQQLGEAL